MYEQIKNATVLTSEYDVCDVVSTESIVAKDQKVKIHRQGGHCTISTTIHF